MELKYHLSQSLGFFADHCVGNNDRSGGILSISAGGVPERPFCCERPKPLQRNGSNTCELRLWMKRADRKANYC